MASGLDELSAENEFTAELDLFRREANAAIQFFYSWLAIRDISARDERVYQILNRSSLFWNTCLGALQTSTFIALSRVFDQSSKHNLDLLLKLAQDNQQIFSKKALARRKRQSIRKTDDWLDTYLRRAYVPTKDDFRRLRRHVARYRRIYQNNYRPLRDKLYAHREVSGHIDRTNLFSRTNIRELQRLLIFLARIHDALHELFHNGWKPNLPPARYSLNGMRARLLRTKMGNSIQEMIYSDAEVFFDVLREHADS